MKSKDKDKYFLPGGKLKAGETNAIGLLREIKEELNIELIAKSIVHEFTITDIAYGLHNTALEMHCYRADFNGNITPTSEIEWVKWVTKAEMDQCAPAAQQVILKMLSPYND